MTMLTSLLLLSAAFALGDANSLLEEDLCPSGWTKYGSRCLMFVKTTRSWPEAEDRRWFWSDGSDFDHQNWAEGRPDAGARESCVHINFGGQQLWNNALCERSLPSVCSLRLLPLRQSIH
ncbi:ladderlectin-like isoform X2 [Oncorhynchus mykiss]|nr:ladderlectin-like isoform X2 [Oncorhynchus mykiss]